MDSQKIKWVLNDTLYTSEQIDLFGKWLHDVCPYCACWTIQRCTHMGVVCWLCSRTTRDLEEMFETHLKESKA